MPFHPFGIFTIILFFHSNNKLNNSIGKCVKPEELNLQLVITITIQKALLCRVSYTLVIKKNCFWNNVL